MRIYPYHCSKSVRMNPLVAPVSDAIFSIIDAIIRLAILDWDRPQVVDLAPQKSNHHYHDS